MKSNIKEQTKNNIEEQNIIKKTDFEIYKIYKSCVCDISLIEEKSKEMCMTLEEFIATVTKYIAKNTIKPPFAIAFDCLLLIDESELIIKYLDSLNLSSKYLQNNMYDYMINYRPDILYINPSKAKQLRKKLDLYLTYLATKDMPAIIHKNQTKIEHAINIIKDFLNSNCSVERYIFKNGISIVDFRSYIKLIDKHQPDLYQKYLEHLNLIETLKSQIIDSNVYNILNLIQEKGNNFSSMDFFLNTIYSINEIIKHADKILNVTDVKLFRSYVNRLSSMKIQNLSNNKFVFNILGELVEVLDEEKPIIINFLKENNIPVCVQTFKDAYIKFYNDKLISPKHR